MRLESGEMPYLVVLAPDVCQRSGLADLSSGCAPHGPLVTNARIVIPATRLGLQRGWH